MVTLVFGLHRLPALSQEEFTAYWYDRHGPLVRSLAEVLRIRRYQQLHRINGAVAQALAGSRHGPEGFDGIAELWFDGEDDILLAATTEDGRAAAKALIEDERRFIDLPRSPIWLYRERDILQR
ncbi:EthD domain-containing protein [Acidiferrimicrobium sp. IK]|uniref:EthD domain-containing protein n=1 Tax=Acidiferrimicrobium sp. IK TaxID=2871700 RepID=UPI0021CB5026|nr:EthD domain-containing protein [Acidiferrimicrobium sp. IK]MCU4183267.1 EthD domain-containing protein [Acidiferrimicrobium sp. IK]